jgi:COP9 signalosome complex subunit 7
MGCKQGAAAAKLIENATSAPGVFVFAELLDSPNIQQVRIFPSVLTACDTIPLLIEQIKLSTSSQHLPYLNLLKIFSYGTYSDYKRTRA